MLSNKVFSPRRVINIGCGKGPLVKAFRELRVEAWGFDVSKYAILKAPESVKCFLKLVDVEEEPLPFDDGSFDLITVLDVLEHLTGQERAPREIWRVLKEVSYILVYTPFLEHSLAWDDPTYISVKPETEWVQLFGKFGFRRDDEIEKGVVETSPSLWEYVKKRRRE